MIVKSKMYSQVNSIINQLGNEYISKLPKDIYEMIITSKDDNYTPNVDLTKSLRIQNISKEAVSIIAYFHIKYWSDLEEKNKMKEILSLNEENFKNANIDNLNENNVSNNYGETALALGNSNIDIFNKFIDKLLTKYFNY